MVRLFSTCNISSQSHFEVQNKEKYAVVMTLILIQCVVKKSYTLPNNLLGYRALN